MQSGEGEWAGGLVGLERNYEVVEELTAECEYLMQVLKTMDARCARSMCVRASLSSCARIERACAAGCGWAHVDVTRGVRASPARRTALGQCGVLYLGMSGADAHVGRVG